MTEDERNLDLLAIFHYIVGGVTALFACIPLIHVAIGLFFVFGDFSQEAPPPFLGWIFVLVGGIVIALGLAASILIIISGRKLKRRRSRVFCLVVAGLECLIMPYGTILGVFTIVTLTKDSVKRLFDREEIIKGSRG
jgi:hypothetical protein